MLSPTLSALETKFLVVPRVVAGSNPGLQLVNAFGVDSTCLHRIGECNVFFRAGWGEFEFGIFITVRVLGEQV